MTKGTLRTVNAVDLLLILLLSLSIRSQGQVLTLNNCRQLAIDNNKQLKAATEQERTAFYQKKEALMKFFPKISASGTYLHFNEDIHLISNSAIPSSITLPALLGGMTLPVPNAITEGVYGLGEIDMSNIWLASVSVTQPIFAGGKIIAYKDLRNHAEKLAIAQKDTKLADVIVEVDEAYWQVVSLSGKKKLAESYVDLMKKLNSDMEELEKEGMATKADRLSVNVKLNEAELTHTKIENGLNLSKMLLCQICGIEFSSELTLVDENKAIENVPTVGTEYDIESSLSQRPEIKSLEAVVKIMDQQRKIARAEYMPTIGLSTGYMLSNPNLHEGLQKSFSGNWHVGVSVNLQINPFTSTSKYKVEQAETRKSQYELEDAKDKIRLQINQANYKLTEANRKIASAIYNVEKAEENLNYANLGFEEGVISSADVMAAYAAWVAAESEHIDADIDLKLCKLYLDRALGSGLINDNANQQLK